MKIFLFLLFLFGAISVDAQTWKPLGGNGQIMNGIKVNGAFILPGDTTRTDAKNVVNAGNIGFISTPGDTSVWVYTGTKWQRIASGSGLALDSARRSNDTLYFRKTTGGEIAVKITDIPIANIVGLQDSLSADNLQRTTHKGAVTDTSITVKGLYVSSDTSGYPSNYKARIGIDTVRFKTPFINDSTSYFGGFSNDVDNLPSAMFRDRTMHIRYGAKINAIYARMNGTPGSPLPPNGGDQIATIGTGGWNGSKFMLNGLSGIELIASETWTPSAWGTDVKITTVPNGTSTQRTSLTVKNNGFVGINNNSPRSWLEINGVSTDSSGLYFTSMKSVGSPFTPLFVDVNGKVVKGNMSSIPGLQDSLLGKWSMGGNTAIGSAMLGSTDNTSLSIKTNNTTRIFVRADGRVGFGTTTPNFTYAFTGDGSFNTFLNINGFLSFNSAQASIRPDSGDINLVTAAGRFVKIISGLGGKEVFSTDSTKSTFNVLVDGVSPLQSAIGREVVTASWSRGLAVFNLFNANKLQNTAISTAAPTTNQTLRYDGSSWIPTSESINGLTGPALSIAAGTAGTDVNVSSAASTITVNVPSASATNRGAVTTGTQTFAGAKTFSGMLNIANTNTIELQFTGSGNAANVYQSSTDPFFINSNTGMLSLGANGSGSQHLNITSNGATGINETSPGAQLDVKGTSASTGAALRVRNSTPVVVFQADNNGDITLFNSIKLLTGAGSPESVKTAPVGSFYMRTDGGAGTTFYVKESGTGNTGWVAK